MEAVGVNVGVAVTVGAADVLLGKIFSASSIVGNYATNVLGMCMQIITHGGSVGRFVGGGDGLNVR